MSSPGEQEWANEDFIPRDEPDPIELLRQYIRQRLCRGATQKEVEDELIGQGCDPSYAIDIVSSVRTTGQYGELEVGTELQVGGVTAGFFRNPVFHKRLRLARRQQRREREAREGPGGPNPALAFAAAPGQGSARYWSPRRLRFLLAVGAVALAALALAALAVVAQLLAP